MKRLVLAAMAATAVSLASWVVARWLERRAARQVHGARALQVWEYEGGNLAPQPAATVQEPSRT